MKKILLATSVLLLGLVSLSPIGVFASEQAIPVESSKIEVRAIPEGAKDITTIKFDNGILSPDVYLSSRLIKLVVWSGGGSVSILVAAIPGLGVQMAQAVVEAVKGYSGTVDNGIIVHFNNGLIEYISGQ